jgi:hypothetical protein
MAFARSLTAESNPAHSTVANHVPFETRPRSNGLRAPDRSAATTSATLAVPSTAARSFPVPAGTTANAVPLSAHACTPRWAPPSPPRTTRTSTPSATALRASRAVSPAL